MPLPPMPSRKQIQSWVDERSFQRGERYFADGAVFDMRREGATLKARCEGSQGGPYWVVVELGGAGIASGDCSCPVGGGGRCKHVAAVLLAWRDDQEQFVEVESVEAALAGRSKEELVALVKQMIREQPDLESLLRTPLPVPGKATGPVSADAYRRQAKGVFERAGDEWGVEAEIADGLEGVMEIGDAFAKAGEPANALAVYEGVGAEVIARLKRYEYEDHDGDLIGVISACGEKAAGLLKKLTDPAARERALRFLFDAYRYDTDAGGIGVMDAEYDVFTRDTTPEERRTLAGWARKEMKGKDGWAKEAYGGFLLDLEADTLDDETFLKVCRETGRRDDLIDRLLQLKRVDEAAAELKQVTQPFELARLADLFISRGHADVAEGVVLERSRAKPDPKDYNAPYGLVTLLEWLKKRAAARRDPAEALALAVRVFQIQPSLEGYADVKERAGKSGQWDVIRPSLLDRLRKDKTYGRELLVRVHLREGELDEAIAALKPAEASNAGWGFGYSHSLSLDVARAAERDRPKVSLEIYRKQAESLIRSGSRPTYKEACKYLKKVRTLYHDLGEDGQWDQYVAEVREKNHRLRALKEEMAKAKL